MRTFDTAEWIIQIANEKELIVVLLDCQGLEKEAFRVLDTFRTHPRLSKIPRVGCLHEGDRDLRRGMQNAGCEQLYANSEVTKELGNILARYTYGFSSRF